MLSDTFNTIMRVGTDRRRFLKNAGIGTAGLAAAVAGGAISAKPAYAAGARLTDADIFNFALNFEYLGAQYYLAALGSSLPGNLTTGTGTQGSVTLPTNTLVPFESEAGGYFAQQLAVDEYAHVTVIREALTAEGASYIAQPSIDLLNSWNTLATAAGFGPTFNPFESESNFLLGAYVLEDVCVTALCGAAALITSPTNLDYAASILGTEGYQVGMIRSRLTQYGPIAGSLTNAISALRSKLSNLVVNQGVDDYGTDGYGTEYNFTNIDLNGQAFRRTPQQVLAIAYGGTSPTGGLFFPTGVNGTITTY